VKRFDSSTFRKKLLSESVSNILFSIVVPAYNYSHTLRRTVESVLRQPGEDYELLVVNDGSTDETDSLLATLGKEYEGRLRSVTRPNCGLAATRNFGVNNTNGQYLIFLDADDAFCDDALSLLRGVIRENPGLGMAVGGHISVDPSGQKTFSSPSLIPEQPLERVKQYLLDKKLILSNGSVAMRREVFGSYRYPEKFRNSEDLSMFAYVLANYSVASVDGAVSYVYKHSDSLRHNVTLAKSIGLQIVDEVFDQKRLPEEFQTLKNRFVMQRLLSLSRTCYLSGDKDACREFFWQALKRDWRVSLRWSYSRKFLKSFL
jgi:glycosyltransferase involved in cell wall biosynthesis